MEINQSIFKSYDIRGIYPSELNEETAFKIGQAFVKQTGAKNVVVAYDARLSGPVLFKSLTEGLLAQGANVHSLDMQATEGLYYAISHYSKLGEIDAGIMITASHNPKEYNGFKMLKSDSNNNISIIRGKDLLKLAQEELEAQKKKGHFFELGEIDFREQYYNFLSLLSGKEIKPLKVVVDFSNGSGNIGMIDESQMSIELFKLNSDPNGNFPNHSPNPLEKGSSDQLKAEIIKNKADCGFIFDGDADRIFLADENGELVSADITLLLLAKYYLQKSPGTAIAYNAICSKAVPEFVKKWGGVPLRTQVGFVNVREGLMKNNGIMGGELSGHYCFKDYSYLDSGKITFFTLLKVISQSGRKVSEIVKELSPYAKASEINFEIEDKNAVLEKIKQKYSNGNQDFLDGVTIEYKNWWFNVRPSNTEPLLRLTIEADTKELLGQKIKELTEFINNN